MKVEWDPNKAEINVEKHGVEFDEAATSLLDPMALSREDGDSEGEARWVAIGMSSSARLLTVVYSLPDDETVRIISARRSTRREANYYA